jgi:acyl-CoA dehydrogenase
VDFSLSDEDRMLKDLVARFVREEVLPVERYVLEREAAGLGTALLPSERSPIDQKARELGLWALDAPEEFGGANLPFVSLVGVFEELAKTVVPIILGPDSPNLRMLMLTVNERQREKYLKPYAYGTTLCAMAISEPGAGGDPAAMTTRAVRDGDDWVLNGRKIWISKAAEADFTILMAVTDKAKGARGGISAFLIDRDTLGFKVLRKIQMLAGMFTYEVALEDCRLPASQLLGKEGDGFGPMQVRLSTRRLEMACSCIGMAQRALDMMCEFAPQRVTFGAPLSERQTIQWWVADAAMKIHACRLMAYDLALKLDQGRDARMELSMIKVFATEMAWEILDHAMQTFGAMGMTKESPLQLMASLVRNMRIYEGPSEVHRWVIARKLLRLKST